MKEIDDFLYDANRDSIDQEKQLKQLLILSDKADMIHHPVAKKKRQETIRVEIRKLRRKISIDVKTSKKEKVEEPEEQLEDVKKPSKKKIDKKRKREEEVEEEVVK